MILALALEHGWPDKQWSCVGNDYKNLVWNDESKKPTRPEINSAWKAFEKEKEAKAYIEKRAAEYPPIGDQLDATLKGFNQLRLNGTDLPSDLDHVVNQWLAVKAKHPKPQES